MTVKRAGNYFLGAVFLFALVFSGHLIGRTGQEGDPSQDGFAFISLSNVLNAHKGLAEAENQIKELLKNGESELVSIEQEMDKMKDELQIYNQESKEYREIKSGIERAELSLKQKRRSLLMDRDSLSAQALKNAFGDVEAAVGAYAREHGLKAVFTGNINIDQIKSNRMEDLFNWVSMVDVVWHDDQLDISDAIITIING